MSFHHSNRHHHDDDDQYEDPTGVEVDGLVGDGPYEMEMLGDFGRQEQQQQYTHEQPQQEDSSFSMDDILLLNHFCANAFPPRDDSEEAQIAADRSWEPVHHWILNHDANEFRAAAEQRDDAGKTALHFACQFNPPKEIIDIFLSAAADIVQWPDSFGWLPIHYACAYGADTDVIQSLADAFPESKTTVDRKGRTPLHFALGTSNYNSTDVLVLLSSTGAASYPDDNGMLPLHYACAYGASEEALYVLTDAYSDAITTPDRRGRTPLHFALSNAGRKASPAAVRVLLSLNEDQVNSMNGGPLPLRVLSEYAATLKEDEEQRESVENCLKYLLAAKPDPTADFFTALQSLPSFLQERAVVMRVVQELLNEKIAQRFPTAILLLDFYMQMLVVVFYSLAVEQSINRRFGGAADTSSDTAYCIVLYAGATYFFMREIIQVFSLISLKALHIWVYEPGNWLNVMYIIYIYVITGFMTTGEGNDDYFRIGAAAAFAFIWVKFLAYLRNILIDFAVFSGGVFHVMRRLLAFLICLMIILIAFSRMFFTLFVASANCKNNPPPTGEQLDLELIEESLDIKVWCTGWDSFLRVYTMLLGEVDEDVFDGNTFAIMLFVIFMLLVVILLANVLIAIVADSYKVIQDQRAAIVFWTNRLQYIAQMDAIANGPWKSRLRTSMGMSAIDRTHNVKVTFGEDLWRRLMELFEYEVDEGVFSFEFLCSIILRICALIFIPLWIIGGAVVAGWLWPPQIRQKLFTQAVSKHSSESDKEEQLRKTQIQRLQVEIDDLREELMQELAMDRTQMVQMKSAVAERKLEIQNEMKHIKRIVTMLFEQQGSS
ncbi:ankyrin repeat domain protein [Nitzschia inconspicua]|uniref:Ankyrin repeat domain protein n=1 Tax=Nitzschia inconspicua TaxID=303405 RepID=A0A9K3KW76_9STRA|nr:ankyrin repeat domain protein [Nitzschia inconspicua]